MSFDILREWDLESFDPGLEFFPETARTTSADIVEPPAQLSEAAETNLDDPVNDSLSEAELAQEAAAMSMEYFSADIMTADGNFDLDPEAIEEQWAELSAARAQAEFDELERERRGVGKQHERFGVENRDSSGARASQRQANDAMADLAQQQATQNGNNEIYQFEGSVNDNGYGFTINGEDYDISHEEMEAIARRQRLRAEEQLVNARANGASDDEILRLETLVNDWSQVEESYADGDLTPEEAQDNLDIIYGNDDLQASLHDEIRGQMEFTSENVIQNERHIEENTVFELDLESFQAEEYAASEISEDITTDGIQSNIELTMSFDAAVMDTPLHPTPNDATNPDMTQEQTVKNETDFDFNFG